MHVDSTLYSEGEQTPADWSTEGGARLTAGPLSTSANYYGKAGTWGETTRSIGIHDLNLAAETSQSGSAGAEFGFDSSTSLGPFASTAAASLFLGAHGSRFASASIGRDGLAVAGGATGFAGIEGKLTEEMALGPASVSSSYSAAAGVPSRCGGIGRFGLAGAGSTARPERSPAAN